MNLPQENFERAVQSASETIAALGGPVPILERESKQRLQGWLWDLEAIGQAIRHDLMNREDVNPIDLA